MITQYIFDADTVELISVQQYRMGGAVVTCTQYKSPELHTPLAEMTVSEGDDAEQEIAEFCSRKTIADLGYCAPLLWLRT